MISSTGHCISINAVPAAGDNSKRRRSGRIFCTGFTLLELVLVMLIICTLLAIASPSLRGFFASRETSYAAEQIVALTRLAQTQAVADGKMYRLNLNASEGLYWLTVQDEGVYRLLNTEPGRIFMLPENTTMQLQGLAPNQREYYIEFDPTGRCQEGMIRLINRSGEEVTIVCPTPTEHYYITKLEDPLNEWK